MKSIIEAKRDGRALSRQQIERFVRGVASGDIPDYQATALLMAIRLNGMDAQETAWLSLAMAESGEVADLSSLAGMKVDKHSTGGVGDSTTFICVPLAAACDATVVKMSGRALGHTGGTLDKLGAIPGFDAALPMQDLLRVAKDVGAALSGQTGRLCPADKILYALRDVTATADSIPLIASSIMSKKIAAGCDAIVLDVKFGAGALLKTADEARELARTMVSIANLAGRRCTAIVTNMEEPLGSCVGNALEVREAVDSLAGRIADTPLIRLSVLLASHMVALSQGIDVREAQVRVEDALSSGEGLRKFKQMVAAQGGDARIAESPALLPRAKRIIHIKSPKEGYVCALDARLIGQAAQALGAGRDKADDDIDLSVGVVLKKRVGDFVSKGEALCQLHVGDDEERVKTAGALVSQAVTLADAPTAAQPLVLEIVEG